MKKQTVRSIVLTVALLLVIACCFGVYMYVKGRNAEKKSGSGDIIFQCSPDSIDSISVKNGNYFYELEKDDGLWELDGDEDKVLNQQSVKEAVTVFSLIKGTETTLKTNPVFSIRVEIDKAVGDFKFELAKDNSNYYLKTKRGKIYSISQLLYSVAERNAEFYRDKTVTSIKSFGEEGENKFVSYSFKYKDDKGNPQEISVRLKNAAEVLKYDTSSRYMLDSPYARSVDAVAFESKVLSKIPLISAEGFISETTSNLSIFGLDKASRGVLTVKYDNQAFVLYVGKPTEDISRIYCMLPDSDEVITVSTQSLDFLGYDAFEFVDKSIFPYNADYVRSVQIESGDMKISVRCDKDSCYVNDGPVAKKTFEDFEHELKKLRAVSIEEEALPGSELMKVTIEGTDGETAFYRVIKTQDEKIIISENDKIFLKTDEKELDAFTEYLKQLEKASV